MMDIIDFICDLKYEDIPQEAVHKACLCLLDAVGCMIGGMQCPPIEHLAGTISRNHAGVTVVFPA